MATEVNGRWGKIIISKEAVSKLAGIATTECFGIVGMVSSHIFSDGINDILGKESLSKGVEVSDKDNGLRITVNVVVGYGSSLAAIAHNVIDNVKYTVEKYVGVEVDHVDVNIRGVRVVD